MLVLHGGVGGWDQAVALGVDLLARPGEVIDSDRALDRGDDLLAEPYTIVAPSRVGYLRTPLATGRTPAEGADAMAALLDALGIADAVVIGVSGGGPTALQFALRHPARTRALALVAAITRRHVQPRRTTESIAGRICFARAGAWLLDLVVWGFLGAARRRPRWFTRRLLEATETFDEAGIAARTESIMRHPEQVTWLLGLLSCAFPLGVRKVGLDNDLAQFAALDDEPAGPITRPTLVVHGRHDGNVPFEHARLVLDAVPGARACIAETCGHLLWMSEEVGKVREAVHDFVREHARDRGGEAGGPTGR